MAEASSADGPNQRRGKERSHHSLARQSEPAAWACGVHTMVVQVLLSQVHRARALQLLGRFLDLGSWAVDLALSVGIFPYVLKLLQTSTPDLRDTLVFIWTKILALDRSCQARAAAPTSHMLPTLTAAHQAGARCLLHTALAAAAVLG